MPPDSSKSKNIAKLIKPSVRQLAPYIVDETVVPVKLDAMENPFPIPQTVRREIAAVVQKTPINLYPDPSSKALKKTIASLWKINPERMLLGNGSDELIQEIILAFGGPVLVPAPTFAMYEITARALAQKVVTVPLDNNFNLDSDTILNKAKSNKVKVIFLACPNNPTGNRFSDRAVRKILENADTAVVIDEAYYSFSGKTWLPMMNRYPNMIVLRTLSKIGFAGIRVGVLIAAQNIVNELNKIRLPYNINSLSQAVAVAALKHRNVFDRQISLLISERKKLYNQLSTLSGITAYPSETNFIMIRTSTDATRIHHILKQSGILVKNLNRPGPLNNCIRVTVGTPSENRIFVKVLKKILLNVET